MSKYYVMVNRDQAEGGGLRAVDIRGTKAKAIKIADRFWSDGRYRHVEVQNYNLQTVYSPANPSKGQLVS